MLNIGCHLSVSKGFLHMAQEAVSIGANTFQFFTRNPQGGQGKEWDKADIASYTDFAEKNNFSKILAHAPYTLNPCSKDEKTREFAKIVMTDDLRKMEMIPGNMYNFHPGSHTGIGVESGIAYISNLLNEVLKPEMTTKVLLETMSGKGSEIGRSFDELAEIISRVKLKEKMGVCLDTCHVYSAGYDIVSSLEKVLTEFDKIIGIDCLHAIHLNDSKMPFASNKDRHEMIGNGTIGLNSILDIINDNRLKNMVFVLETPNDIQGYAKEIKLLRSEYKG